MLSLGMRNVTKFIALLLLTLLIPPFASSNAAADDVSRHSVSENYYVKLKLSNSSKSVS